VRVASYNIHGGVGRDGRCDLDRVVQVIAELDADLIGLQEVGSGTPRAIDAPQWDYLGERLAMAAIPGPTLQRAHGPFGNALLSRHPAAAVRHIELNVPPFEPRAALVASVEIDGARWHAIVTHLGLRWRERYAQTRRLAAALAPLDRPTLLFADANAVFPWSPGLRPLRQLFGRPGAAATFPAARPLLKLDRIWSHPVAARARVWAHSSARAREASDHLPICAEVAIKPV